MCRLLGCVAREPVAIAQVLGDMFEAFVEVSSLHADGWGLAWYDENGHLLLAKAPEAAHASKEFSFAVEQMHTDALIGHVRWASPGFPLCLENTHPFTYNQMAFAHNGAVSPNETLEVFIAPHLRKGIAGATDSERHFLALLSELEKAPPIEAFRAHLRRLHQHLHSSSLNCLLLTPDALYAVCDFDPNAPMAQKDPDYFHLQYHIGPDVAIVGSTGLNQESGWEMLQNGQMLIVERDTLEATIVDVDQGTRISIQEQYKSTLQR